MPQGNHHSTCSWLLCQCHLALSTKKNCCACWFLAQTGPRLAVSTTGDCKLEVIKVRLLLENPGFFSFQPPMSMAQKNIFSLLFTMAISRYRHYKPSSVQNDCHINLFQWPFSFVAGKNKREVGSLKHFPRSYFDAIHFHKMCQFVKPITAQLTLYIATYASVT